MGFLELLLTFSEREQKPTNASGEGRALVCVVDTAKAT